MSSCLVCGETLVGKRDGAMYCSNSCRSNACQKRKRQESKSQRLSDDMFTMQLINTIKKKSPASGVLLMEVYAVAGRTIVDKAIEAVCMFAEEIGQPIGETK